MGPPRPQDPTGRAKRCPGRGRFVEVGDWTVDDGVLGPWCRLRISRRALRDSPPPITALFDAEAADSSVREYDPEVPHHTVIGSSRCPSADNVIAVVLGGLHHIQPMMPYAVTLNVPCVGGGDWWAR